MPMWRRAPFVKNLSPTLTRSDDHHTVWLGRGKGTYDTHYIAVLFIFLVSTLRLLVLHTGFTFFAYSVL
jgi:hypothetical protein